MLYLVNLWHLIRNGQNASRGFVSHGVERRNMRGNMHARGEAHDLGGAPSANTGGYTAALLCCFPPSGSDCIVMWSLFMAWKAPRLPTASGCLGREGTADTTPGKAGEGSGGNGERRPAAHGEVYHLHPPRIPPRPEGMRRCCHTHTHTHRARKALS